MESQSHVRSSSTSSSSSFDSCSDLLCSLDVPLKDSVCSVIPPSVQQQETVFFTKEIPAEERIPLHAESCDFSQGKVLQGSSENAGSGLITETVNQEGHVMEGSKGQFANAESGDLMNSGIKEDSLGRKVLNFVNDDANSLSNIDVITSEVPADEALQNCPQLQSSSLLEPGCESPISSAESVDHAPGLLELKSNPIDVGMVTSKLKKGYSLQSLDNGEGHLIKGMESVQCNIGSDSYNGEHISRDIMSHQPRKVNGSEDMMNTYRSDASLGGSVSQLFAKSVQGQRPVDMRRFSASAANFKGLGPSQVHLLLEDANPQNREQPESDLMYKEQIDDQSMHSKTENERHLEAEDEYLSGSNIVFGQSDWDAFMHESLDEKAYVIDQFNLGSKTGPVGELVEGANLVNEEHGTTTNPEERMFTISESDHDLQQLEDSIKFFELHKPKPILPHPLRTLSSGSGRPDLEEVDEQVNLDEFAGNQFPPQSSSLSAHAWKGDDFAMKGKTAGFPLMNSEEEVYSANRDRESLWHEGAMLASGMEVEQALDASAYNISRFSVEDWSKRGGEGALDWKEGKHQPVIEVDLFGKVQVKGKLKSSSMEIKGSKPVGWEGEDLGPDELFRYVEALDVNEAYVDTVLDMEDVLLDSDESSRGRFLQVATNSMIGSPRPSRDGSLSSSTSGMQHFYSSFSLSVEGIPFTVDWVEVVGARQRKGGSSIGERMVGVKDHTVYCIKVLSGKREWEVFRRYRDFVDLYHQLKRIFNSQTGKILPSAWEEVESESRKVFGNTSPNVIEVRSFRIERCLQSLLQAGLPFSTTPPLFWFLRPHVFGESHHEDQVSIRSSSPQRGSDVQLGALDSHQLESPRSDTGSNRTEQDLDRSPFTLGKTIKLIIKVHPNKSLKQLLYAQHYSCAGCYKHLDIEKGLMQGFVQTLGWGKPRLCEYSGQLFCNSCHLNETAVLPAQVLRHWDFSPRRVSQLAKAYLDSIYDQPMLCVSAVNPYLYTRVPILAHVKETRRRLSRLLSCIHCPSRGRIQQTLGSRRYLLENNDFFALRDLEDLSKGAFAVLPGLLTAIAENLKVHITKQCSVCQDTGEWCGSGILCEDPFSPIFPFQEEDVTNCKTCHATFHKKCFQKCISCPSCSKDWSNKATDAGKSLGACQDEELHDYGGLTAVSDGQSIAKNASSSSVEPEFQSSSSELEKESHNKRSWDFHNLLSKRRLW